MDTSWPELPLWVLAVRAAPSAEPSDLFHPVLAWAGRGGTGGTGFSVDPKDVLARGGRESA